MSLISDNITRIRADIPDGVRLVCVSKFHPFESIEAAYQAGEHIFGESRVQELIDKYPVLPKDIQWHFIGHLQTNKVKFLVPFVDLIHGVDSLKLLQEINRQAAKIDRRVDCLLQVHIATEDTKFGFSPDEIMTLFAEMDWSTLPNIRICGLMGMATFTDNQDLVRSEFRLLNTLFSKIKKQHFADATYFKELSMGMSDDFRLAIAEGSTLVRVGSSIFGSRQYRS